MKSWMKIVLALIVLGIIGAGLGYKFIYNKPHRDYEKAKPDFVVTSEAIFQEYRQDKETAQQKYNGKVVQITGMLSSVETADSLTIAVFVLDEGMFGDEGIRCSMLPNHRDRIYEHEGSTATVKGYLTGYNDTDIILESCSLIDKTN